MDAADYEFVRIAEFDMKELNLFETTLQCGKKRAADEGIDNGVGGEKKAKMTGPVKIGREAAEKYWQSLIDAGRELGTKIENMKVEAFFNPPFHLRNLTLNARATTTPTQSIAFAASMRAKVNLIANVQSASSIEDAMFECIHCNKLFKTKTALGQHIEAKHEEQ